MKGKNKCKILKEIRQRIADENDIPYVTRECSYQGDCKGSCPKCEAELRYLEQELEKRRSLGKTVAVAAVAAGLSLSLTVCVPRVFGNPLNGGGGEVQGMIDTIPPETPETVAGELPAPSETEEAELMGDVAYLPDTMSGEGLPMDELPTTTEAR